jgi:hypothetical protein
MQGAEICLWASTEEHPGVGARALLSGMMVTRLRSCPLASSALAVASLSTTTCATQCIYLWCVGTCAFLALHALPCMHA